MTSTKRAAITFAALWLLISGDITAQAVTDTVHARPMIDAAQCIVPPKIDGSLNDSCWKTATHLSPFHRLTSAVTEQTEAWICADSTHLYIAFHCFESHPNLIRAEETQRNGNTYVDDYVAVDIDSQGNHVNSSQFVVTARGTQNENLEGGTADNITWAGDWKAAEMRTSDGWNVEMSIPFALLRYPRGTHKFGLQLERKLARDTSSSYWPDRPGESQINPIEYWADLTGISPKFYRAQPIFLPYTLLSAGQGYSARYGMDVKVPLSTGLTGLATYHPDFTTVEQNATNINFSYTAHFINDQRPFFAEGSNFFPYSDIFYSPSIGQIDEGVKVTGKQNGTAVALMATNTGGSNFQRTSVASFTHDLNPLSNFEVDYAGNDQAGIPSGDVVKTQLLYGTHTGRDFVQGYYTHTYSWLSGDQAGNQYFYELQYHGHPGHPVVTWQNQGVQQNFNTELGFEPNFDYRQNHWAIEQSNRFDKGYVQTYDAFAAYDKYDRWSDHSFFQDSYTANIYLNTHTGNGFFTGYTQGRHLESRDHIDEIYFEWSNNSPYGGGNIDYQTGSQNMQQYRWYSVNQGYGFSQKASVNLAVNWQYLGSTITSQIIFTPNYKLTAERSVGGRIIVQNNQTDLFLTFTQKVRRGSDIYLIFGNPNAATTQGLIELKIVTPF